jgi:molybdopterin synthase sulfur carrier subunit
MPTVKIPPVLRPKTGGESEVSASGASVGQVLAALAEAHPDTREQLFGPDGDLNRYSDTVVILPAMAGGAA